MTYRCHELLLSLICVSHNNIHEVLEFQLFIHFLLAGLNGLDTKESGALGSSALLMTRELKYICAC